MGFSGLFQKAYARDFITELGRDNPLGNKSLVDIVDNIFTWLVSFAAIIVPIIIIWGAFQILTSGGETEKWNSGKKAILYAVIGFAIILMAKGIANIIKTAVLGSAA